MKKVMQCTFLALAWMLVGLVGAQAAEPAGKTSPQAQSGVIAGDTIVSLIDADALVDAAVDVYAQTGVAVNLPVLCHLTESGDTVLEYPECFPGTPEAIRYDLSARKVIRSARVEKTTKVKATDVIGRYAGSFSANVEGKKSFVKVKGKAKLDCTLLIQEVKQVTGKDEYTVKGSLAYSGTVEVKGHKEKVKDTLTFDHSKSYVLKRSGSDLKYEFTEKTNDYKVSFSIKLNGKTASGSIKVSGKYDGIDIKGDGDFDWTKKPL